MNPNPPPSQQKHLPLIQDPPASPARSWLNQEVERVAQRGDESSSDSAPVFLLFEPDYSDDQIGGSLPVAMVVKIDQRLFQEMERGVENIASGLYKSLELTIPPENVRWLRALALHQDNSVAPIEDWFDPEAHYMVGVADAMNMEYDDETVAYGDACQIYQGNEAVLASGLTISKGVGLGGVSQIYIGARGHTKDGAIGTIMEPIATLKHKLAPHAPKEPRPPVERP